MTLTPRALLLTILAMLAFAANSLFCRAALNHAGMDAGEFTVIRIAAGAAMLWLVVGLVRKENVWRGSGSWRSALALVVYAFGFSYAYKELPAAVGSLVLIGSVQVTMIGYGLAMGERPRPMQLGGLGLALLGLICLLMPGLTAPPFKGAALMIVAGIGWGAYSLRGRGAANPSAATAGNFLRAVPFALILGLALRTTQTSYLGQTLDIALAVISGALTSGLGYIVWYSVLPFLAATEAATVQLSVPVLTAIGGVLFLSESMTLRLLLCSAAILGGIGLVIAGQKRARPA